MADELLQPDNIDLTIIGEDYHFDVIRKGKLTVIHVNKERVLITTLDGFFESATLTDTKVLVSLTVLGDDI